MHCIVPFAAPAPGSEAGQAAMAQMQWPRLSALLPRLVVVQRDEGEPTSLSPPHERALAHALGWSPTGGRADEGLADDPPLRSNDRDAGDGTWPWAARSARADGIEPGEAAWGLVSPVHWHVGTDQVSLVDPQALQLDEAASRALFEAVRPLFSEEDIRFAYGHATRWYVADESLQGLATASLDRVAGRNVDVWLGSSGGQPALKRWRRLQAEAQMLLHNHPLNAERESRGLLPVNSFWLSGCGRALPEHPAQGVSPVVVEPILRAAALAEDGAAWAAAWGRFEAAGLMVWQAAFEKGAPARLTLAGERTFVTLAPRPGGWLARLKNRWAQPSVAALLQSL